jgi:hypothetical protein
VVIEFSFFVLAGYFPGMLIASVANVGMHFLPEDHLTCIAYVRIDAYEFERGVGPFS